MLGVGLETYCKDLHYVYSALLDRLWLLQYTNFSSGRSKLPNWSTSSTLPAEGDLTRDQLGIDGLIVIGEIRVLVYGT